MNIFPISTTDISTPTPEQIAGFLAVCLAVLRVLAGRVPIVGRIYPYIIALFELLPLFAQVIRKMKEVAEKVEDQKIYNRFVEVLQHVERIEKAVEVLKIQNIPEAKIEKVKEKVEETMKKGVEVAPIAIPIISKIIWFIKKILIP